MLASVAEFGSEPYRKLGKFILAHELLEPLRSFATLCSGQRILDCCSKQTAPSVAVTASLGAVCLEQQSVHSGSPRQVGSPHNAIVSRCALALASLDRSSIYMLLRARRPNYGRFILVAHHLAGSHSWPIIRPITLLAHPVTVCHSPPFGRSHSWPTSWPVTVCHSPPVGRSRSWPTST